MQAKQLVLSFDIGIKNMALCLINSDKRILKWGLIDITSERKNDLDAMSKILVTELDQLVLDHLDTEYSLVILIENQPVMKAPTMKSIQMIIYTYFRILEVHEERNIKIHLVSAMRKNMYMKSKGYDIKAKDYKSNKINSIKFVEDYLISNNDQENLEYLRALKKKDDICDAFLQILSFNI